MEPSNNGGDNYPTIYDTKLNLQNEGWVTTCLAVGQRGSYRLLQIPQSIDQAIGYFPQMDGKGLLLKTTLMSLNMEKSS